MHISTGRCCTATIITFWWVILHHNPNLAPLMRAVSWLLVAVENIRLRFNGGRRVLLVDVLISISLVGVLIAAYCLWCRKTIVAFEFLVFLIVSGTYFVDSFIDLVVFFFGRSRFYRFLMISSKLKAKKASPAYRPKERVDAHEVMSLNFWNGDDASDWRLRNENREKKYVESCFWYSGFICWQLASTV